MKLDKSLPQFTFGVSYNEKSTLVVNVVPVFRMKTIGFNNIISVSVCYAIVNIAHKDCCDEVFNLLY